ncbi:hypothetical protein ACFFU8_17960 [Chromobacterium piscinae]|uniref:hypothetical protein n=1 Tax=Chromobacterium piscinae TaxID=686831 RepID=UPI001E3D0DA1|nr:hypothetical protein [Chromobacterium piscinae]MCD5326799.1 hypothetical protein [Chromobacterium piscinae]
MIETNYRCDGCGKFRQPDVSKIGVGDFVNFSVTTPTSHKSFRSTAKEGEVVSTKGDTLRVKGIRGGFYWVARNDVTPKGAPNALTYSVCGVCKCGEGAR